MKAPTINPLNDMVDSWVHNLGALCWAQDQGEKMLNSWLSQGRIARDEAQELAAKLAEQTKSNQRELQNFIHHTVALSLDSLQRSHKLQLEQLEKQLQQMQQAVSELQQTANPGKNN